MLFTAGHDEIRRSLQKFIANRITLPGSLKFENDFFGKPLHSLPIMR